MIPLDQIRKLLRTSIIAIVVTLCSVGIFNTVQCGRNNGRISDVITKVDTLYLRDTIRIFKPTPVIIRDNDTILVQVKDTIRIKDTIYIKLPKEQRIYQDENYLAWISGFRPELDSIHIFQNTLQIITPTSIRAPQKNNRWGIGIYAGYGLTIQNNAIKASPNISVGLSYNLLMF